MKKPAAKSLPDPLRLTARQGKKGDEIVVWLDGKGTRPKRIGSVNRRLALDARRYGQDLVGDLVDTALLEVDRRLTPRAPRQ
ncbi:MAG: hypothetical protein Q8L22_19215 [Reyranella sp.]|nr:hypothetical protein [Reyranella sp.]